MNVLLVEDEPLVRELLHEDLADAGLAVHPVDCAEAGLAALETDSGTLAVLVTDVNLGPGMDGVALVAEAQRRWPHIGVVVMTGEESNLGRLPEPLRHSCLIKPFNPPRLVAAVNALVASSA